MAFMQPQGPLGFPSRDGGLGPTAMTVPVKLTKMGPMDDLEAFLVIFKQEVTASQWPPEQWAIPLVPHVTWLRTEVWI